MEQLSPTDRDAMLSDKLVEVERLQSAVNRLEAQLKNEMETNAHVVDLNVELKGRLREAGHLAKVRVHPSSMRSLQDLVEEKNSTINTLRQTLGQALKLIPDDRIRKPLKSSMQQVYQRTF